MWSSVLLHLLLLHLTVWDKVSHRIRSLPAWPHWPVSEPQPFTFMGSWEINLGALSCPASTLLSELSTQPWTCVLIQLTCEMQWWDSFPWICISIFFLVFILDDLWMPFALYIYLYSSSLIYTVFGLFVCLFAGEYAQLLCCFLSPTQACESLSVHAVLVWMT